MNRLEEELRITLRREPAPAGFVEKIVERVAKEPVKSRSSFLDRWRQAWFGWFEISRPAMRGAVAAAVILLAVGLLAFWMTRSGERAATSDQEQVAQTAPANPAASDSRAEQRTPQPNAGSVDPGDSRLVRTRAEPSKSRRIVRTQSDSRVRNAPERIQHHPSSEAEAAKEQVMLALQIASSTLGDVQRSVQEADSRRSR
jgi:hypothetical protein